MFASRHSLRVLGRMTPRNAPRFVRSMTFTVPRAANEDEAGSSDPASSPIASSSPSSPSSSSSSSSSSATNFSRASTAAKRVPIKRATEPSTPNPLHRPPIIPADEARPYQYPEEDQTPLPTLPSSFEPSLRKTSSLAKSLDQSSGDTIDWGSSFHGLSTEPFSEEARAVLLAPIPMDDVEVKPDGILYLPEIKYRRILNTAFGPGGWGLAPRGELHVGDKVVTREFALVVGGRFVAVARGECGYYGEDNIPNAVEGCKSNALTRCCKDIGIASELWDPRYIRRFVKEYIKQVDVWYGSGPNAKRRRISMRKDDEVLPPYRLAEPIGRPATSGYSSSGSSSSSNSSSSTNNSNRTPSSSSYVRRSV